MSFTVGSKMRFLKSFIACGTLQYDISFEAFILHFKKLLIHQKCAMKKLSIKLHNHICDRFPEKT